MTISRPPRDTSTEMARLIEAGSRIRSLHDDERSASFERWELRKTRADGARRRIIAGAGLAGALALGAYVFSLDGSQSSPMTSDVTSATPLNATNAAPSNAGGVDPAPLAEAPVPVLRESVAAAPRSPLPSRDMAQNPSPLPALPAQMSPSRGASPRDVGARVPAQRLSLGGRGELELSADTRVVAPSAAELAAHRPLRVRLERGRVWARIGPRAPDEPFAISTPHLDVIVVGTRFSVAVDGTVTTVAVEHGRVRVEKDGHAVLLDAGQALRSDDARLDPARSSAGSREPTCSAADELPRRRECLARAAAEDGLGAQNALLTLGLLEREGGDRAGALARFREYERRYPRGVLAPEVSLALVQTLMLEGGVAPARAAAADYARRFPDDAVTARRLRALADGGHATTRPGSAPAAPAPAPNRSRR